MNRRAFDNKLHMLALSGVMSALIMVVTMYVSIPIPNTNGAYINAGDALVYTASAFVGGWWGVACAALGSALADILIGSAIYAPATLVIKGAMALIATCIMKRSGRFTPVLAIAVGGAVMPVGYFLYETVLYGAQTALVSVPMNLIQYVGGVVIGALIIMPLKRVIKK